MIYLTLFLEFLKIGSLAIGGGLVTIPFLITLSKKHSWFSLQQLADMIAISEATPGPIGINMATFTGYKTADLLGGAIATLGLVTPSIIIMIFVGKWLLKNYENKTLQNILSGLRPAVLSLIAYGGFLIAKINIADIKGFCLFLASFAFVYFYKRHPIIIIILGGVAGVVLKL